uniref:Apple domain-containing protein n=1 Tax=Magallana gigas TaxID=29159 RepID=K1QLC3_MAGGI
MDLIGKKMCENQCLTYSDCKAINFNKRHLSCELLNRSGQEAPEHLHFEEGTVHIYNITKSQLSNLCANKTCPAHHRCVAGKTKTYCIVTVFDDSKIDFLPEFGWN